MSFNASITTTEIKAILADEIGAAGGRLQDCFGDGKRLFARTVLPWVSEVRPNDRVQGGVALRASESDVWVHPYLFRQVCTNGQIIAQSLESQHIEIAGIAIPEQARYSIREAVRACATREAFDGPARAMGAMSRDPINFMIEILPILPRVPAAFQSRFLADLVRRITQERDHSRYGALNAVTSLARDTRDPELRWKLEEAGGAIITGERIEPRVPKIARMAQLAGCR